MHLSAGSILCRSPPLGTAAGGALPPHHRPFPAPTPPPAWCAPRCPARFDLGGQWSGPPATQPRLMALAKEYGVKVRRVCLSCGL